MTGSARTPALARAMLALAVTCLALQASNAMLGLGGDPVESAADGLLAASMALTAAATLVVAACRRGRYRIAWCLVGCAQATFGLGEGSIAFVQDGLDSFPTLSDVLWLSFYPLVLAAIAVYLTGSRVPRPRLLLDAGIAVLVLIAIGFAWVFGETLDRTVASEPFIAGQLSYPLLDLGFVAIALVLGFAGGMRLGGAYWAAFAAAAVLFYSDLVFVQRLAEDAYEPGTLLDSGWATAMVLLSLSAQLTLRRPEEPRPSSGRLNLLIVLTLAPALAVLVRGSDMPGGTPAVACAAAAIVLMAVRLMLTLGENQRLARDMQAVVKTAGEGILRTDRDGRITDFNPAAATMLGYLGVDLRGADGHDVIHHSRPDGTPYPKAECPIQATLRTGVTNRVSTEVFWRRDGTPLPVDYTVTPLREDGRLAGVVVVFDDVTEQRSLEQRLRHQAEHDSLSGLYNRRAFIAELERRLDPAAPDHQAGAVIMFDLDSFKFVNDSFGHPTGDAVIRDVSGALRERFRGQDILARLGGDEFAALVPDVSSQDALALANRVVSEIMRRTEPTVEASAGVAIYDGGELTADDVVVGADIALYEAKQRGGGQVASWDGSKGRLAWVEQVREAIRSDRILLHTQPIIDLRSGRVVKEEVLARLVSESGQALSPASFLPTAERFGLVAELDRAVLAKAIELASPQRPVAVNVSGASIADEGLLSDIAAAARSGLGPSSLTFEVTETAAIGDAKQARRFAGLLELYGFELALDDFGTGVSSLSYLKSIPAQVLKIDLEFVRNVTESSLDQYLVSTIVSIAHRLGQKTVAEGIEDAASLAMVAELGVDQAQGNFIGPPVPAAADGAAEPSPAVREVLADVAFA